MVRTLRFFEILITGILLTVFVVMFSVTSLVFNKNVVKKELDDAGVYEKINKEMTKTVKEEISKEVNKYPELSEKLDDIIDNTLTDDVLKKVTDNILTQIYNGEEKIYLDPNILIDGYRNNLDKYLEKENIAVPVDIEKEIDNLLNEVKIEKADVTEYTEEIVPYVNDYKDISKFVVYLPLLVSVVFICTAVIISKEKLKVVYKPLILSSILLLIIRLSGNYLIDRLDLNLENDIKDVFISVKSNLFYNIDLFAICFLIVGIGLLIINIMKKKKEKLVEGE